MNRAVRNFHRRRCALKNVSRGGGLNVNPGAAFATSNGVNIPENQGYSECYAPVRPGALTFDVKPELAQVVMAGGGSAATAAVTAAVADVGAEYVSGLFVNRGVAESPSMSAGTFAAGQVEVTPVKIAGAESVAAHTNPLFINRQVGAGCGCSAKFLNGGSRRAGCGAGAAFLRGGRRAGCGAVLLRGGHRAGCGAVLLRGGKRTRRMRGGRFSVDPSMSVGGTGPIAEPARFAVPCDPRAGMVNPFSVAAGIPNDPRAPAFMYSATPNTSFQGLGQTGGAYSSGNAYPDSCYRATGSQLPVYPATTAGFEFRPSTGAGATLPDGVTAYNEVVPVAARQAGGKRKSRRSSKKSRKAAKKSRKH